MVPPLLSSRLAPWLRAAALLPAAIVVLLALGWAFFPDAFAAGSPFQTRTALRLRPPSSGHWFGTDYLGRDLYTRVVHGAALSLKATVIAVALGFSAGSAIGLVAGFAGGRVEAALMRLIDVLLAVPGLLLSLTIVTVLGFGTVNVAIAVGVTTIAAFARVMRAEVLRVRACPYVEAAAGCGVGWLATLLRHVLPNAAGPVLALAGLEVGAAILMVSSLSFLGFGAPPPAPEWGSLVAEGRNYMATAWWLTVLPGLVVVAVVLAVNQLGRALDAGRAGLH
ncbi:ABC transporter permease [Rhodovastum atsumiense]|uniref:ABC transporter permease n=1 Tax=Rhodovastum atsumiense TaxID=504468 RepID=A0A5M6IUJ1_9PROT|nr:ABC transporter permease [Rhodovastum atsumiense]KAA5611980.1 ABC transporter permease [Rhodovastum atsumiense]CAH2598759.1 ABC transporter permease [Rhodovastum atsumiense]